MYIHVSCKKCLLHNYIIRCHQLPWLKHYDSMHDCICMGWVGGCKMLHYHNQINAWILPSFDSITERPLCGTGTENGTHNGWLTSTTVQQYTCTAIIRTGCQMAYTIKSYTYNFINWIHMHGNNIYYGYSNYITHIIII